MTRLGTTTALIVIAIATLTACGDDGGPSAASSTTRPEPASTTTRSAPRDPAVAALCAVLETARAGDLEEVRATFDHGPLHSLADELIDLDRGVAAELLVAKEAVESGLAAPDAPATQISEDLEALVDATARAIATRDETTPTGCEEETR